MPPAVPPRSNVVIESSSTATVEKTSMAPMQGGACASCGHAMTGQGVAPTGAATGTAQGGTDWSGTFR
jgi:hypothetical protein